MIETEVMSNRFIGDGNNKSFAFGFKFNNKNDIQVWLYDSTTKQLTKRSDFTLTPNNSAMPSEGGTVTFPSEGAAIPSTQMVIIQRHMNLFQLDVYKHGMFLDLDNFEHSLDTLVMELQQINDSVERAVKVSIVPDAQQVDPIMPPLEAGQTIMVSEDGTHFVAADISELFAQTTSAWKAAETSQKWAEAADSPNDEYDSASKTGKTQSSKSWALDSKASQQAALASQNAAKTSETNAKASETAAKTSETNAKASETAAKTSETNADESEANAKSSEQAAALSEANASASEQAAATSETNAKKSETAAKTSETNAENWETMSQKWAESPTSPDGLNDETSDTGKTQSSKEWAKQAERAAQVFQDFTGATAIEDGTSGKVIQPKAGEQNKILFGCGVWGEVSVDGTPISPGSNMSVGNPIMSATVSGRVITFTRKDGSKFTITTQDTVTTNTSNWSVSKGTNGWARDNSTGFTIQWGSYHMGAASDGTEVTLTFPRSFSTCFNATAVEQSGDPASEWVNGYQIRWVKTSTFGMRRYHNKDSYVRVIAVGVS